MTDEPTTTKEKKYDFSDFSNWDNNWAFGVALIVLGGLFLLDTFNLMPIRLHNWWAIFILVPGLNAAANGFRTYRETQSTSARRSGIWGVVMIAVAFTFFFNISWSLVMPALLIGAGVYLLVLKK